jgi:hypothetical protein
MYVPVYRTYRGVLIMRQTGTELEDAITIPESFKATGRLTAYKSRVYFDAADLVNEVYTPTLPTIVGVDDVTHPVSATQKIRFYFDEGAVRIAYIDGDDAVHISPGRIFDPVNVLPLIDEYEDDSAQLINSGAAIFGDKIFAYFTRYDGAVQGIYYKLATNNKDGSWSDFFIAIPEDLSNFDITGVFVYNERVFMVGRFYRQEEFETSTVYTLLSHSDDGIVFSLDRRVLVSQVDLRFSARYDEESGDIVFFTDTQLYRTVAPYQVIGEDTPSVDIVLDNISGDPQAGWAVKAKASDELYLDNPYLDTGTYSKLEIGVHTIAGLEWLKYHDVVIARIVKSFGDGVRGYDLSVLPDGLWHTSSMTHPFYLELQGKQSILDLVKDKSNLYDVNSDAGPTWTLSCDFWTPEILAEGGGLGYQCHEAATATDHWCADIETFCTEYPVLDDAATIEVRSFGWSRAGIDSGAPEPNPYDPTPHNSPNDDFYALLLVEDENGLQSTVVSTLEELDDDYGGYSNPPQTYFPEGARAGSYPVVYQMVNPGEGKKLIKVGIRVISDSGATVYYPERVELPGITVNLIPIESTYQPGFVVEEEVGSVHQINGETENPWDPNIWSDSLEYLAGPHGWNYLCWDDEKIVFELSPNHGTGGQVTVSITFSGSPTGGGNTIQYNIVHKRGGQFGAIVEDAYSEVFTRTNPYSHTFEHTFETDIQSGDWFTIDGGIVPLFWDTNKYIAASINVTAGSVGGGGDLPTVMRSKVKGIPQILFSSRPFSAWNFDCDVRVQFKGEYTSVGPLGLGSDKDNFVLGYISEGKMGLAKIRGGRKTILLEQNNGDIVGGTDYDMRLWHRDGLFGLEVKEITTVVWPTRGSQLLYSWLEADGSIVTVNDIFHVGIYGFIDPPRFRTTGFCSTEAIIPVLPLDMDDTSLDSDFVTDFPTAGEVDIDGTIYKYTGKNEFFNDVDNPPNGPFQLRNYTDWGTPYNSDPGGGYTYQGGMAVEFYQFKWLDGAAHSDDLEGAIVATSAGYAWLNQNTQWKVWITTVGQVVWARERARHYSEDIPDYSASCSEKMYLVNGLTGVSLIATPAEGVSYPEGTFVYIHSKDTVELKGFYASSNDHDNSITSLLEKFCRIAGTDAAFPGDIILANGTYSPGEEFEL